MILCSGCFDGLHAGHVAYLEAAKQYAKDGESMTVAVAPDEYIRRHKGREPHWTTADRMRTVGALRCVDHVVLHDYEDVSDVIDIQKPRIFVKGSDWIGRLPKGVEDTCAWAKTQIVYVNTPGKHTSNALSAHQ